MLGAPCRGRRRARLLALTLVLSASLPWGALGQQAENGPHPDLRWGRELVLFGAGGATWLANTFMSVDVRPVPPGGLDPSELSWGWDRNTVGNNSLDGRRASYVSVYATLAFPLVLVWATSPSEGRWEGLARSTVVYAEASLIAQGITRLAKTGFGRARPYAYVAATERPAGSRYDVTQERTFRSMPSGHASTAWTAASVGLTEHLLRRPSAGWLERAGVGFVGGALAGGTSALRVRAGQHFPTDVVAGAGIGIATGVTVPLLHRDGRPLPPARQWLETAGGTMAGTIFGVVVAQLF